MAETKRFIAFLRKPEYLDVILARTTDPNLFIDKKYTTAVSYKKALANFRYRYPDRTIIEIREIPEGVYDIEYEVSDDSLGLWRE